MSDEPWKFFSYTEIIELVSHYYYSGGYAY